jgi:hypothetical protein
VDGPHPRVAMPRARVLARLEARVEGVEPEVVAEVEPGAAVGLLVLEDRELVTPRAAQEGQVVLVQEVARRAQGRVVRAGECPEQRVVEGDDGEVEARQLRGEGVEGVQVPDAEARMAADALRVLELVRGPRRPRVEVEDEDPSGTSTSEPSRNCARGWQVGRQP